jgi:hypothetical protein
MADDLIDLYLGGSGKVTPNKETSKDGSLMDMYLSPPMETQTDRAPVQITVRPPISGATPEQSAQLNAENEKAGAENKTKTPPNALASVISGGLKNIGSNIANNAQSGVDMAMSGVSDAFNRKPAAAVGKMGLGALSVFTSPFSGAINSLGQGVSELTGSKEIGDKVGILASALPVSAVGNAMRPITRAFKDIVERIGQENIPQVIEQLKANPRLTLMDVSVPVKTDAQGLASSPSSSQTHLENFVKERTKGERGVVEQAYNDVMGPTPNVKQLLDDISAEAKKTGKDIINPAVKGAAPVDISPVLAHIESRSKPGITSVISAGEPLPDDAIVGGLKSVRKFLTNDKSQRTDATSLHNMQSAMRAKAENLLSSSSGQDRLMGYELMNVRNKIVDAIDTASGPANPTTGLGPYKTGLSKYRDDKQIGEALEEGTKIFKNNGLESRPEFFQDKIANANAAEKKMMQVGARIAVDNQIRGMRFAARRGKDIPEVEFNAEKLEMLFGEKEVKNLQRILSDEKAITDTHSKLFQNSQTAMRLAGQKSRQVREPVSIGEAARGAVPFALLEGIGAYTTGGASLGLGTGAALALGGGKKLANMGGRALDRQTNLEYSRLASATGEARDELIKKLESLIPSGKPTMLSYTKHKLGLPVRIP